ncbi:hypothetical protein PaG_00403 [Moesziomyces aphidis]|uniref:Uncharacterized protein n=1 Tax=Moesziomyces aphidis TaxID=84754 RepID=W3VTX8_MOEAP|nr:hypothetical protein PaG_00403 [Moesziomyces aphidis]
MRSADRRNWCQQAGPSSRSTLPGSKAQVLEAVVVELELLKVQAGASPNIHAAASPAQPGGTSTDDVPGKDSAEGGTILRRIGRYGQEGGSAVSAQAPRIHSAGALGSASMGRRIESQTPTMLSILSAQEGARKAASADKILKPGRSRSVLRPHAGLGNGPSCFHPAYTFTPISAISLLVTAQKSQHKKASVCSRRAASLAQKDLFVGGYAVAAELHALLARQRPGLRWVDPGAEACSRLRAEVSLAKQSSRGHGALEALAHWPDAPRSASVFTLASRLGTAGELQFSARLHVDPLGQPSVVPIDAGLPRIISELRYVLATDITQSHSRAQSKADRSDVAPSEAGRQRGGCRPNSLQELSPRSPSPSAIRHQAAYSLISTIHILFPSNTPPYFDIHPQS